MNVCGITQILVPASFTGLAVTSLTGNELLAWIVAAVVALAIWGVGKARGTTSACPIPQSSIPQSSSTPAESAGSDLTATPAGSDLTAAAAGSDLTAAAAGAGLAATAAGSAGAGLATTPAGSATTSAHVDSTERTTHALD